LDAFNLSTGVIVLSGDVHYSEIFKFDCPRFNYPIYEFTSSGLTHSSGEVPFGSFLIKSTLSKWSLNHQPYRNFGIIDIAWDAEDPYLEIQSRTPSTGEVQFSQKIFLRDIQYDETRERNNFDNCFKESDLGLAGWKKTPKHLVIFFAASTAVVMSLLVLVTAARFLWRLVRRTDPKEHKPEQKKD
jgi:hypothetical protein